MNVKAIHEHNETCDENTCKQYAEENTAIDWIMAVRKYGLETANQMFPEG